MLSEEQLAARISEEASTITGLCQRGHDISKALQTAIEADAVEQLRQSQAALEDGIASLRKDHNTSLIRALATLQMTDLPSQAEWTSPTLRAYSERANGGIETASPRVGTLAFNAQWRRVRIPLRLELLNRCNLILLCEQDCRSQAVSILQSILLRTLITTLPGKLRLRCFDATEHGRAFSAFLHKLPIAVTGGRAGVNTHDFDSLVTELEGRVAVVAQTLLNATTPTLSDHNTATKGELEPYYAVALDR